MKTSGTFTLTLPVSKQKMKLNKDEKNLMAQTEVMWIKKTPETKEMIAWNIASYGY